LALIVTDGIVMPLTSTVFVCVPADAPSPHTCSSQSVAVPPASDWQSASYASATEVSSGMLK